MKSLLPFEMIKIFILSVLFVCPMIGCKARKNADPDIKYRYDSLVNVISELNNRIKYLETGKQSTPRAAENNTLVGKDNPDYFGLWNIEPILDDYGETTGLYYVTAEITGEILNNASSISSAVKVKLYVDENSVWLEMYEYFGRLPLSGKGVVLIRVKDRNNSESLITCYNSKRGDISIIGDDAPKFMRILLSGGRIMFIAYCSGEKIPGKQYKFTIENADFLKRAIAKIETMNNF